MLTAHGLYLDKCRPGKFSDNDKWLKNMCDENNKIIESDTFKTGDLSNYLIFSDMRARGSFHHLPQLSPTAGRIAESL